MVEGLSVWKILSMLRGLSPGLRFYVVYAREYAGVV